MRTSILLLVLSAAILGISSCTSAYKTGQTPDDVYFSPERPVGSDDYVRTRDRNESKYQSEEEVYDDRYVRMKIRDRRWAYLDNDYYYNRRYSHSYYNCYCSNPWTPYTYWNYTYNPYGSVVIINPKSTVYSGPRVYNLNSYNNNQIVNNNFSNPKVPGNSYSPTYSQQPVRMFNNNSSSNGNSSSNVNSNSGNFLRNIFGGSGNSNSSSGSSNSSTNSSSNSSSNNSSSGSAAPVRKF